MASEMEKNDILRLLSAKVFGALSSGSSWSKQNQSQHEKIRTREEFRRQLHLQY